MSLSRDLLRYTGLPFYCRSGAAVFLQLEKVFIHGKVMQATYYTAYNSPSMNLGLKLIF